VAVREVAERHVAEVHVLAEEYLGTRDEVEQVAADELEARLAKGTVIVLDVRPETEFRAGHIPGAVSAPLDSLELVAEKLPRRREIVAYCRGPYCVYSDEALRLLHDNGFQARRLSEGFPEWRAAGYPVETANGTGSRSTPEASKVT
jgi:rhodanese-related sulfurtransferase